MTSTDLLITGQVAIVTGGGGGIGRACALRLAEFGADVLIADIIPERAEETAERVRELGRRALAAPTDMMDTAQVTAMVAAADTEFGRLDILVNNVGGVAHRPFAEQNERNWRRHIDLNLISMLSATSAAISFMARSGRGGSIVNVASIEGVRAAPGYSVYAACKAAMLNFTQTMALELSGEGIRVNAINPDHTVTPGGRGNRVGAVDPAKWIERSPEAQDAMDRLIPLGREGFDTECADAVAYLCSPMASYITGVTLPVDGGTAAAQGWQRTPDGSWTQIQGQQRSNDPAEKRR
ncbi:SDR family NAD(P)-dependent oxidoreductase [Parasphingorhabdus sp.]|uniref:SDR family NAD(P)-dependent oxidoreductase n=1 Tax=Parasphingorhabdus sp. TaxID=2709688 RepID=UPI003001E78F